MEIDYTKLQQEIIMQEYRLWDCKRNGIDKERLQAIETYISQLKEQRKPHHSKITHAFGEDAIG